MKGKGLQHTIQELCEKYDLTIEAISKDGCQLYTDNATGVKLVLKYDSPKTFEFYFVIRTYDVVYRGDRSDAHVILCLMFTSFIRSLEKGMSCSMFDIAHPVVEDEVWGRYILPEQKSVHYLVTDLESMKNACEDLIIVIVHWRYVLWNFLGCPCDECRKRLNIEDNPGYELPDLFSKTIRALNIESERTNHNNRLLPKWNFYYDIDREITIIKSEELALCLQRIQEGSTRQAKKIAGVSGELIVDGEIRNYIEFVTKNEIQDLLSNLKSHKIESNSILVLENMVIAYSSPFIVALGRLGGLDEFKNEKEEVRRRHNLESEILFPISKFEWQEDFGPGRFEDLVKSLLELEPGVLSVRKPAPVNQGDKGRDLLIEWSIANKHITSQTDPPTFVIKVVGQCKVCSSTVGKSKVLDIRDTVETHDSSGYFLAVNTQISAALTEKLENLKSKGIWTEWWNKEEIESRLSKHPEILAKFSDIIQAKDKVKFYKK